MATSYESIFDCFLRKIDDPSLAQQIRENTQYALEDMTGWLHSAVAKIGPISANNIVFDDDNMQLTGYDSNNNEVELDDFAIEMYALGMKIEWLTPMVNRTVSFKQILGGKEEQFFSQQQHITAMKSMLEQARTDLERLRTQYHYRDNDYIED